MGRAYCGRRRRRLFLMAALAGWIASSAYGQDVAADHYVPSRPENLSWGFIPTDKPPVLTIRSGETVRIDTISHHGSTQAEDPVTFLGGLGVGPEEILQDVRDFWASKSERPRDGRTGAHVLTGPIAVRGAEPGDALEVQILDLSTRVPYGINTANARSGVLDEDYPGTRPDDSGADIPPGTRNLIRTGVVDGRAVAILSGRVHVPLAPFMGIMAVAPRDPVIGQPGVTVAGLQSSRPPGPYGGNLDVKDLTEGTSLFLPVFHPGALFYAGDPHGAQGDGEVSGTALEQSLSGAFRFVLHKDKPIAAPRAETPTHYIFMGIDVDLDRALRRAVLEVLTFLEDEQGLTPAQAYALASIGVDFRIAEAVNETQNVSGWIEKSLFR